ncbi:MAG: beta-ketoacyl-[acyl-carrier-protein] synthase II [Acidobacteria bacterium]|nr:MAG: beta-ketoacyl-[acyl-carrier-protein] synthase II [Acidobacteriota bacterium]
MSTRRRVVISGVGACTALGSNAPRTWSRLVAGECGIRPFSRFDTSAFRARTGAELLEEPIPDGLSPRQSRRMSRTDLTAFAACREALAGAGIDTGREDPSRLGVFLGAASAGLFEAEQYWKEREERGIRRARLSRAFGYFLSSTTDHLASLLGAEGPSATVVTACSSSTIAIGRAWEAISDSRCDLAVAGGADTLSVLTVAGFNSLRAVDPDRCRPFDARRNGMSLGEGAGILLLEEHERARRRGAPIIAEVLGYGLACDAYHPTAPHPQGAGSARAMEEALRRARVDRSRIDYISAHGTGTLVNDEAETRAIHRVFGERARKVPVSSIKSMLGHCLGAAGAVEAVALALTVAEGVIPPTAGWEQRDPACDLDYVPGAARQARIRAALSNSFGFGGNNATLVLGEHPGGHA